MTVGVGASGFLGIAKEVVSGTYIAPTKYMVLTDESMKYEQATKWRRPLRGIADIAGGLAGNSHVSGSLSCEITEDTLPYILLGCRGAVVKTGTTPNILYTFTPNASALPANTLSITVVRNGMAFGYTGCVISSQTYSIEDGTLMGAFDIIGRDEATQTLPTPTHVVTSPFGDGSYMVEIPTATQVFDADSFSFKIDDAAEPQFRLKSTRGAQFVKYGERDVEITTERDFESRSEYDAYKALTALGITLKAGKLAVPDVITFSAPATIKDSYEISGLTGQADLIRAAITYKGTYDATTSRAYQIICKTSEDFIP
jgi:hypothetical protein